MPSKLSSEAIEFLKDSIFIKFGETSLQSIAELDRIGVKPDTAFYELYAMPGVPPIGRRNPVARKAQRLCLEWKKKTEHPNALADI